MALFFICTILSFRVSAAEWKLFFNDSGKYYIDTSSIVQLPINKVRAWQKLGTAVGEATLSLVELDCDKKMVIFRQVQNGSIFAKDYDSWTYIEPTNFEEARYRTWCKFR
jgi:hypothetical protein